MDMKNLSKITNAQTRSVSPENITGEKGMGGKTPLAEGSARHAARDLGTGWKVNPYFRVAAGETITLADVTGEGAINHIWMTPTGSWRMQILRFYWDGETEPAIECPMGDFFLSPWGKYKQISSLAVCVNPGCAFNSYWRMPFKKGFRVTLENLTDETVNIYYQITYSLESIPEDEGYFHAQFRRVNPLPYKDVYTILEGIEGKGQYVGTSMGWGVNNDGWWGEGEIKFYMDGDEGFPTICGTGTEDYFCGSYNFENPYTHDRYEAFTTPYAGMNVMEPDHLYRSRPRFSLYRLHITDPIRFDKDLSVTIQALGWRSGGRYLPLQDDISSVAYFYLDKPVCKRPALLDKDGLEII